MKSRRHLRRHSIMTRIMVPMILVMLLQAFLFAGTVLWGGTINQLNSNACDIFNEQVSGRKNYLQNEMIQRWSNIEDSVRTVQDRIDKVLKEKNASTPDLTMGSELSVQVLSRISPDIIYMLRRHSVTGAFIVFNGRDDKVTTERYRSGLYIRDLDPLSNPEGMSDLLIERAPSALTKELGIPMDVAWMPGFSFDNKTADDNSEYYNKPYQAAIRYPDADLLDLGYWSKPFCLQNDDVPIITYSVPLIDKNNQPYGVMGIEVTLNYIKSFLPYSELNTEKKSAYILGLDTGDNRNIQTVLSNGATYKIFFGEETHITCSSAEIYENIYTAEATHRENKTACLTMQYLKLYNTNTPFEQDRWVLAGMVDESSLFGFADKVKTIMFLSTAASILIGIISLALVATLVTRPVKILMQELKASDPSKPLLLDKIHISEFDELSSAIEHLSSSVAESSSRMSQILEMAGMPIGVFNCERNASRVFCTKGFFQLFGLDIQLDAAGYLPLVEFRKALSIFDIYQEKTLDQGREILFQTSQGIESNWVKVKIVENDTKILGVAVNVTQEVMEKKKIEHERDHDLLTNLLNRRAFHAQVSGYFQQPEALGTAAFIMLDLDNLKYVNDTYGHDYGDEYIRHAANILKRFTLYNAVVARMSGDEFYVFIYGYESREAIGKIIDSVWEEMRTTSMALPDGKAYRIRASAGIAWYPDDTAALDQLIRYADFAMYQVKHTKKGEVKNFDVESYNQNSFMLHSKEELDRLIEEQLVTYVFQPIVDVANGEVFAYEALMRPQVLSLSSPIEVLKLARSQFRLYQIERLTWFKALEYFSQYCSPDSAVRLFLNSIPNQMMIPADLAEFEKTYAAYLEKIVVELTEDEKLDEKITEMKRECVFRWNGRLALDDFGTGYNGDSVLLMVKPDYVKIDMSIVRNIDTDQNRQSLFCNLRNYARQQGMKVIAEGIETFGEMRMLIALGADYLQGYYISRPQPEPQDIPLFLKKQIRAAKDNSAN